jgi:hypothetical protein
MIRIYCDGCGEEIPSERNPRTTVTIEGIVKQYELCAHCRDRLKTCANPHTWLKQTQPGGIK